MSFAINRFNNISPQSLSTAMNDVAEGVAASLSSTNINQGKKLGDPFKTFDPGLSILSKASGSVSEVADFSTPTSYLPAGASPDWDQVVSNLNSRTFDIGGSLNSFADQGQLQNVINDQQASALDTMNSRVNNFVDLYRELGEAIGSFMWMGPISD